MPVFECTDEAGREAGIAAAVSAVGRGELVVLPTDTVYGVGCDAFTAPAVAALLAAKGRGREMPPPVLVPSPRTVDGLAIDVPAYARDLMRAFWPGALTLVLKAQPSLRWDLGETNGTVAVRMPADDTTLMVLSETGPLAVTSANRTGEAAALTCADAVAALGPAVSVYLDGGTAPGGEASTIVDCTRADPVILRHGALNPDQLRGVLAAGVLLHEREVSAPRPAEGATGGDPDPAGEDGDSVDITDIPSADIPPAPPVGGALAFELSPADLGSDGGFTPVTLPGSDDSADR